MRDDEEQILGPNVGDKCHLTVIQDTGQSDA
jgi:hypothetical protein